MEQVKSDATKKVSHEKTFSSHMKMNLTFQRTRTKENTMTDIMTEERSNFDTPPYS